MTQSEYNRTFNRTMPTIPIVHVQVSNGDSMNVDEWLNEYESQANLVEWTDEEKYSKAVNYLAGYLKSWYAMDKRTSEEISKSPQDSHLRTRKDPFPKNWLQFKIWLKNICPAHDYTDWEKEAHELRQKPGENQSLL